MNKYPKISASIMCMDPYYFQQTFDTLVNEKIDYIHIDVMDGHFVPNLGIGTDFIKKVRKHVTIPFDYHLMVEEPDSLLPLLGIEEGDMVSVHYECSYQIQRTLEKVREYNAKLFLAINPATPIYVLDELLYMLDGVNLLTVNPGFAGQKMVPTGIQKARKLVRFLHEKKADHLEVQVDGNISFDSAEILRKCGANIFVAGTSSIFNGDDLGISIRKLQARLGIDQDVFAFCDDAYHDLALKNVL